MVTALFLSTVTPQSTGCCCFEPTKNLINFLFLNASKLLKIMLKYPYLCLTLSSTPKCFFFFFFFFCCFCFLFCFVFLAGRHFFIGKIKFPKWRPSNTCAFKSCEKCGFTSQNFSSDVLQGVQECSIPCFRNILKILNQQWA